MRLLNRIFLLTVLLYAFASCSKVDVNKTTTTPPVRSDVTPGAFSSSGGGGGGSYGGGDSAAHAAGILTAGEWNDFDNWAYWLQLNSNDTFKAFQDKWQFYPNQKWMFTVKDAYGKPLPDASITISSAGTAIWTGRTNKFGILQAVPGIITGSLQARLRYSISYHNRDYASGELSASNREVAVNLPANASPVTNVDLMFVIDATGSMGDEITYLKNELGDVLTRAKNQVPGSLRYAGIVYRDFEDDYLTRATGFASDESALLDFIKNQEAGGGGDYPEAVEEALKTALQQQWSDDARARLLFLILDAPVHDDAQKIALLKEQVKLAAAKGITIIPISASGTDKPSEFLFRYLALATNGTYTFLTDDSGVGNSHITPTVGDYKVEFLNDLIVRLIAKYGGN